MRCTVEFRGHRYDVEVKYSPGTPDVRTLPNGDPGYPGDPAEVEFVRAWDEYGNEVTYDRHSEFLDAMADDEGVYRQVCEAADRYDPREDL